MAGVQDKPVLEVASVVEWERFMDGHARDTSHDGVRLRLRKTASAQPGITYAEALDAALCHGWIDGRRNALDADYHLQVFTPRRPRSLWSQRNRDLVERLIGPRNPRGPRLVQVPEGIDPGFEYIPGSSRQRGAAQGNMGG